MNVAKALVMELLFPGPEAAPGHRVISQPSFLSTQLTPQPESEDKVRRGGLRIRLGRARERDLD